MAILRQQNWLGQQRVDVPHLRSLESSIAADFDMLAGKVLAGSRAVVVSGFTIVAPGTALGGPATALQLNVASGTALHPLASESGTIFQVPSNQPVEVLSSTNPAVSGSFTPGQTNYIGLDLRRMADDTTSDLVMFLDANTLLETPKTTPLARTLRYKIIISTTDFTSAPNVLPLAKVKVLSNGNVDSTPGSIEDARAMLYRLGSGGSTPSKLNTYSWPGGRDEKVQNAANNVFSGGDKGISSFKEYSDAILTRLWELGGGEFWYSGTADRDTKVIYDGASTLASNNDNYDWTGTALTWSGVSISFANSTATYNTVTGNASGLALADGECLYVDVDRSTEGAVLTAAKSALLTLGTPTVPGSRFILARRKGNYVYIRDRQYEINRSTPVATTTVSGTVKLSYTAGTPSSPVVIPLNANGGISVSATTGTAIIALSSASGSGISATGGGSGSGVFGQGGASGGRGGEFTGTVSAVGVYGQGGNNGAEGGSFIGTLGFSGVLGTGATTGTGAGVQGAGGGVGPSGFSTRERGAGARFLGGNGSQGSSLRAGWGVDARGGTGIAANQNAGGGGVFQAGAPNGSGAGAAGLLATADGATTTSNWTQANVPALVAVGRNVALDLSDASFNLAHGILAVAGGVGTGAVIRGGATSGVGVDIQSFNNTCIIAQAVGGNFYGINASGSGTGAGGQLTGGSSGLGGPGGYGVAGGGDNFGWQGNGSGTGYGIGGTGGTGGGHGVVGLGQGAGSTGGSFTGVASSVDCNAGKIINVANPTLAQDAATKSYVDSHPNFINLLINGNFHYFQRGTTSVNFSSNVNSYGTRSAYFADRWYALARRDTALGTISFTASRQNAPATEAFRYMVRIAATGAQSIFTAGPGAVVQEIDRDTVQANKGRKVSFRVRVRKGTSATGTFYMEMVTGTGATTTTLATYAGGSIVGTLSIPVSSLTSSFVNYTYTISAVIPGNVTTAAVYCSYYPNPGNPADANDYVEFAEACVTPSDVAPPLFVLAGTTLGHELALCQRFYEKSWSQDGFPGNPAGGQERALSVDIGGSDFRTLAPSFKYHVVKRVSNPTVTLYSGLNGSTTGVATNQRTSSNVAADASNAYDNHFIVNLQTNTGVIANDLFQFYWTADAEI